MLGKWVPNFSTPLRGDCFMSRQRHQEISKAAAAPASARRRGARPALVIAVLALLAALAVLLLQRENPAGGPANTAAVRLDDSLHSADSPGSSVAAGDIGSAETEPVPEVPPEPRGAKPAVSSGYVSFGKLQGSWVRTDGSYAIEVRNVADDGKMVAAYFNPRPIRVAEAKASREGDKLKVFIELRDVGYPACTYRLDYNPQNDSLEGIYYQAALGQNYEVVFLRLQ